MRHEREESNRTHGKHTHKKKTQTKLYKKTNKKKNQDWDINPSAE